jgi:type VI secretion system protein ImpK
MNEDIARLVQPVFIRGLDLRRRLEAGESPAIETEQATLEDLIRRVAGDADRGVGTDPVGDTQGAIRPATSAWIDDLRYVLTCWLDEMFILESPWDSAWTESKLEARLFGSNDRAWRFWELSEAAERLPGPDALEVFYLCVALGFRGELVSSPERLKSWIDRAGRRLAEQGRRPEVPSLEPPCAVPPLRGGLRFRAMVIAAGCVAILSIPALVLIVNG